MRKIDEKWEHECDFYWMDGSLCKTTLNFSCEIHRLFKRALGWLNSGRILQINWIMKFWSCLLENSLGLARIKGIVKLWLRVYLPVCKIHEQHVLGAIILEVFCSIVVYDKTGGKDERTWNSCISAATMWLKMLWLFDPAMEILAKCSIAQYAPQNHQQRFSMNMEL